MDSAVPPLVLRGSVTYDVAANASRSNIQIDAGVYWIATDGAQVTLADMRQSDAGSGNLVIGGSPRFPVGEEWRLFKLASGNINIRNTTGGTVMVFIAPAEVGTCSECG